MPRFFFDIYDGVARPDQTGKHFETVQEAQDEAARVAADFLRGAPAQLWRDSDWTVWVRDESKLQLFAVVLFGMLAPAMRGDNDKIGQDFRSLAASL